MVSRMTAVMDDAGSLRNCTSIHQNHSMAQKRRRVFSLSLSALVLVVLLILGCFMKQINAQKEMDIHFNDDSSSYCKCDQDSINATQVHLTVGTDPSTSMTISFNTRRVSSSNGTYLPPLAGVLLVAQKDLLFFKKNNIGSKSRLVLGKDTAFYNYSRPSSITPQSTKHLDPPQAYYESDWIHHVNVTDLNPSTIYYYQPVLCSRRNKAKTYLNEDPVQVSSLAALSSRRKLTASEVSFQNWYNFSTAPLPGSNSGPITFALVGDLGVKAKSKRTMASLSTEKNISSIVLVGDVSYANGDQSIWDDFFTEYQNVMSHIPVQIAPGNHEIEVDGNTKEIFKPYDARFRMPQMEPVVKVPSTTARLYQGSELDYDYGNAYYSYTNGPARFIMLSSFSRTHAESKQYAWLQSELRSIDRQDTPWVFVGLHKPLYNSFNRDPKGQVPRNNSSLALWEDLFVRYKVNVCFGGHVHAYMRSVPVAARGTLLDDARSPIHVIIGDGGYGATNKEVPQSPPWTIKADPKTPGFGLLHIYNHTHARWQWVTTAKTMETREPASSYSTSSTTSSVHDEVIWYNQYYLPNSSNSDISTSMQSDVDSIWRTRHDCGSRREMSK